MAKRVKVANIENCSGCQICALVCSFFTSDEKRFSLSQTWIKVSRQKSENRFQVELLPQCTHCGLCVKYCYYGVLTTS
nr:hypothetical protein [Desulfobacterales bacterium]